LEADSWQLVSTAGKWLSLLAMAGVVGGHFSLALAQYAGIPKLAAISNYVLACAVSGICTTLMFFFVQIGSINQTGITGMFDRQMGLIIGQSSLGYAIGLRIVGFVVIVMTWLTMFQNYKASPGELSYKNATQLIPGLAIVAIAGSFALTGHTTELPGWSQALIVLHVLAAFLWVGSLYPLLRLSADADLTKVKRLMHYFGITALFIVAFLLLTGITLVTLLLQSFSELVSTDYGMTLLLKLVGVIVLLTLAGINKLFLVPRITQLNSVHLLQASIHMEICAAICILAATTWLTTAVGPASL
jgi:copper resistance protein D